MKQLLTIAWQVALTVMLMALSGKHAVELPGIAVPITLQSMLPILLPLVLRSRNAVGGVVLYLVLGSLGLPVFANGASGFQHFQTNSGGYLIGFYIIALASAAMRSSLTSPRMLKALTLFIALHVALMIIGLTWIWLLNTSDIAFSTHVQPFLPGLVAKSVIGALIFELATRLRNTFQLQTL